MRPAITLPALALPAILLLAACTGEAPTAAKAGCDAAAITAAVQHQLDLGSEATRREDIDGYMALIPPDLIIQQEDGSTTSHDALRAEVLRDWSVIEATTQLSNTVTKVEPNATCDAATVWTDQAWERVMQKPDKSGTDLIRTTQSHKEQWRLTKGVWYGYDIEELGGEIFVNGEPYTP